MLRLVSLWIQLSLSLCLVPSTFSLCRCFLTENVSSQLTDSMLSSSAEHCARDTGPGCPCKQTAQGHPRSAPPLGPLQVGGSPRCQAQEAALAEPALLSELLADPCPPALLWDLSRFRQACLQIKDWAECRPSVTQGQPDLYPGVSRDRLACCSALSVELKNRDDAEPLEMTLSPWG